MLSTRLAPAECRVVHHADHLCMTRFVSRVDARRSVHLDVPSVSRIIGQAIGCLSRRRRSTQDAVGIRLRVSLLAQARLRRGAL